MNDSQSTLGGANQRSRAKPIAESSFIQPNRENIYDVEVEEIDDELIEINQSPIDLDSDRPTKPQNEEEHSRIMKVSDKIERKKGPTNSPPTEIKGISVVQRREH